MVATHALAGLIPASNVLSVPALGRRSWRRTRVIEDCYSSGFVGAFATRSADMPDWARRVAEYDREAFRKDNPHKRRRFSDLGLDLVRSASLDGEWLNYRHALELHKRVGGVEPFTEEQDFGSCVDASFAEMLSAILGWRVANPDRAGRVEKWLAPVAWYLYAERGYCSDGWNGYGIARQAVLCGLAFRKKYAEADFTNDDENERLVSRSWCRSGIPETMLAVSRAEHGFQNGAITEFDGDVAGMAAVLAAGGALHFGGTRTSGGSRPFLVGSVGGHQQATLGGIGSERFRKFCADVVGEKLPDNDFAIINDQTWGSGWSGEVADRYWPDFLGPKPQGAWIWRASQLLRYFEGDIMAYLPLVHGVPGEAPPPPPPPPPPPVPVPGPGVPAIGGELTLDVGGGRTARYIVVPKPEF